MLNSSQQVSKLGNTITIIHNIIRFRRNKGVQQAGEHLNNREKVFSKPEENKVSP